MSPGRGLLALLAAREWRHHPWRHAMAVLAVALGVALAWSVHLINASALAEFSGAVRAANGEPDLVLRAPQASLGGAPGFDEALFDRIAADPAVEAASPVVEVETYAPPATAGPPDADGLAAPRRVALRVVGIDVLRVAPLAPGLLPRPAAGEGPFAGLDPDAAFPNAAAREKLALADGAVLRLQSGPRWQAFRVAGTVPAGGPPLVVMDLYAAQQRFGLAGRLTRIDLRLAPGSDRTALLSRLALPPAVQALPADEAEQRLSNLSRAYRVNLTVLALVALFVGAFLVFSVVALSVAQRTPSFALLGVLGMTSRQRRALVLGECALLGAAGSALGLALGTGLAWAALRFLAGDLGGGYFPGIRPSLQFSPAAALVFAALGVAAALAGGWWPARHAERLAPARALKGLGDPAADAGRAPPVLPGLALLALGGAASLAPPWFGLPLAAYAGVAALLVGGVALVPAAVHALLAAAPPLRSAGAALPLLALRRAAHQRRTATAAVAGVVASLALSVALTVMVGSFRQGVDEWLGRVLPADLYARSAGGAASGEQAWLPADFAAAAAAVPGVLRVEAARVRALALTPGRPAVSLVARPLPDDPTDALPFVETPLAAARTLQAGEVGVWVSEAMVALYDARPGTTLALPLGGPTPTPARVLGVWRDYARQFGAVVLRDTDYRRVTGDTRLNDLALWLSPGADAGAVQRALRERLEDPSMIEFAASGELRALSLRIFDRSFAVTRWLQGLAIAIGLVGVAASLSAQVLARRKEFGLLGHLGLTRAQVVGVVAGEAAAWMAAGVAVGLVLGLAVSAVLVHVVNPQSFHWTMPMVLPPGKLAGLCAAVFAAGVATSAWTARRALSMAAVRAVKEDW